MESGLTFRFFYDRAERTRLHVEAAHAVTPGEAIETFFAGSTVRIDARDCYETSTDTHILAWLWMDDPYNTHVMVITCVTR